MAKSGGDKSESKGNDELVKTASEAIDSSVTVLELQNRNFFHCPAGTLVGRPFSDLLL